MHKIAQARLNYESFIPSPVSSLTNKLPAYDQAVGNLKTITFDLSALSFLLSNFALQPEWDGRSDDVNIMIRSTGDLYRRITDCLYTQLETFAQTQEEQNNDSAVN